MQIGESFVGSAPNEAHINTVLGERHGPAGVAWATALASPSIGHSRFVAVLAPSLPVKPPTLFVNKAAIEHSRHGEMTWGPAQAGVAAGVADAVALGVIPTWSTDELALIAAVWVNPAAHDAEAVYHNNRQATREALDNGASRAPDLDQVLAARYRPGNPYFTAPE
ncbi:formaldehyde-activating enzyme [Streptomyces sp. NPDC001635]